MKDKVVYSGKNVLIYILIGAAVLSIIIAVVVLGMFLDTKEINNNVNTQISSVISETGIFSNSSSESSLNSSSSFNSISSETISKPDNNKYEYGNLQGNLSNYGQVAFDGTYIYFRNWKSNNELYKAKPDGSGKVRITNSSASSINVLDGYIYYKTGSSIEKIKTDDRNRAAEINNSYKMIDEITFKSTVDTYLIAYAEANNLGIFTRENHRKNMAELYKIPDVCDLLKIKRIKKPKIFLQEIGFN